MKDYDGQLLESIQEEYEKTLGLPATKQHNQYILCPIGIIGSGKTTVIKPLAEELKLLRISTDEIRKIMHDKNYSGEDNPGRDLAMKLIDKYARMGYSIAVDSDCVSKIEEIEEESKKLNIKIIWIHINPPEEFIVNKLKNYKHTWLFESGKAAVKGYLSRKPLHENINLPFSYTFDTSRKDLDKQIKEATRVIKSTIERQNRF